MNPVVRFLSNNEFAPASAARPAPVTPMKTFYSTLSAAALMGLTLTSCETAPTSAQGGPIIGSAGNDTRQYGAGHAAAGYTPNGYGGKPTKFIYAPPGSNYVPGTGKDKSRQNDDYPYADSYQGYGGGAGYGGGPGYPAYYGPLGTTRRGYAYPAVNAGYGYGPRIW